MSYVQTLSNYLFNHQQFTSCPPMGSSSLVKICKVFIKVCSPEPPPEIFVHKMQWVNACEIRSIGSNFLDLREHSKTLRWLCKKYKVNSFE